MTATTERHADHLLARLAHAADEVTEWTEQRDAYIEAAARAGVSQRAIGRAAGLTHPGVAKILARRAEAVR